MKIVFEIKGVENKVLKVEWLLYLKYIIKIDEEEYMGLYCFSDLFIFFSKR